MLFKGNSFQNSSSLSSIITKDNIFFAYGFANLCICKYNKTTVAWTCTENDWLGEFEKQKQIKTSARKKECLHYKRTSLFLSWQVSLNFNSL